MKIIFFNYIYLVFAFILLSLKISAYTDLEQKAQEFVLETKQIIISEYPNAFNPSIIRWNNSNLMSFRVIPDPKHTFNSWIGLIRLDEKFRPIGKPQQLKIRPENAPVPSRIDDGRLVSIDNRLYLVYSDNEDMIITRGRGGFRMYIAELDFDGKIFFVKTIERLSSFEGNSMSRREKNWVPFDYYGQLLLAYSIVPHRILRPVLGSGHCETFVSSESLIKWNWGELRGGTTALLDGDNYLAFFHSSKPMVTTHSQGKEVLHYFMGAYTFSNHPPFAINQISNEPIIGKKFYNGPDYKPYWKPVKVVFPCGFIFDDNYIWIAYGRQDHEIWITKLNKKKLYASLVPVSFNKNIKN